MNRRTADTKPPIENPQREAALRTVRKLMAFWGLTPKDLRRAPEALTPLPREQVVRYRHPATGECWDGSGPQPDWLKRALLTEGYTVAQLRVGEDLHARLGSSTAPEARGRTDAEPDATR
ncbi:H-NS histone family protein [Aquabacterium sp. A7-Y]|uniref:H-NS family nucleoid-associated regulatory protein n=1 Tax=Aquabacterium sp. A7-Y TaxID=1349605 RepID=UPI00223CAD4A|nr:H-NS family nucleoid-associated regulatory protein [Aquabacterium sp. A7-Y]MCW7539269.1 H-NS histone family protein [Aquabacterium sp. A7-Y]